uniref:Uncharacterized protein n=1 Tax=Cyprinodon variegatus TaxID=28743 RepID=A0A3Q2EHB8_CYPVA
MVRKKGSLILCGAFLFVAWNALLLLYLWGRPPIGHLGDGGGAEPEEMIRLAEEVEVHLDTQKKLLKQIESHRAVWAKSYIHFTSFKNPVLTSVGVFLIFCR